MINVQCATSKIQCAILINVQPMFNQWYAYNPWVSQCAIHKD